MQTIQTDIIIIGAGIAGLWLHHRLNDLGFHALLIDKSFIGNGQTLSSQGIIHGGAKYSLNGILSNATSSIADMPDRWISCLKGNGEVDLSATQVLSHHQLMWSTQNLSSKISSFFSSKALHGKIQAISPTAYPDEFKNPAFKGNLYQLNEPVLDVPSLLDSISKKWRHRILRLDQPYTLNRNQQGQLDSIDVNNTLHLQATEFILTSGEGNEKLLNSLNIHAPKMQRRPLQMVLTSHCHTDKENVWYIGGNIAEDGVKFSSTALIEKTKKILDDILPWISTEDSQWETHSVNRAEPAQKNRLRPDTAFVESVDNIHIAWPTKLALAPDLSDKVLNTLQQKKCLPNNNLNHTNVDKQLLSAQHFSQNTLSPSLWERLF